MAVEQDPSIPRPASMPVWDPLVRLLHWSLVATVAGAWITHEGGGRLHEWLGYAALGVAALRIAWGFSGRTGLPFPDTVAQSAGFAQFVQFVRSPATTMGYAKALLAGCEHRYIGHNPLGAWMVLLLLAMVIASSFTGWLYITDRFWGVEWVADLHEWFAVTLLGLIALHVTGVVFTSKRHKENLVAAMFNGRKRAPAGNDEA